MKLFLILTLMASGIALTNYYINKNNLTQGPDARPAAKIHLMEDVIETKQAAPEEIAQ